MRILKLLQKKMLLMMVSLTLLISSCSTTHVHIPKRQRVNMEDINVTYVVKDGNITLEKSMFVTIVNKLKLYKKELTILYRIDDAQLQ